MSIKISLYKLRELIYVVKYGEILIDIKPDDGHVWPKHVVFILSLKNIHLFYNIRVVFLTTLPPI